MLNFLKSKPAAPAEPEETLEEVVVRRESELRAELHAVCAELARIDAAARRFLHDHTRVINCRETLLASTPAQARELEAAWCSLAAEDGRLNRRKNILLSELAALRTPNPTCYIGGRLVQHYSGGVPMAPR